MSGAVGGTASAHIAAPQPRVGATEPVSEVSQSSLGLTHLDSDGTQRNMDAAQSGPDGIQPGSDGIQPVLRRDPAQHGRDPTSPR